MEISPCALASASSKSSVRSTDCTDWRGRLAEADAPGGERLLALDGVLDQVRREAMQPETHVDLVPRPGGRPREGWLRQGAEERVRLIASGREPLHDGLHAAGNVDVPLARRARVAGREMERLVGAAGRGEGGVDRLALLHEQGVA